jgi:hypothetical protein
MRFSFLTWENVSNIPLPHEVREITKELDWSKQDWQVQGLPIPFARYSILDGKTLYLDELPNGEAKTQKMDDFTGKILIASFFIDKNPEGFNYFVTYVVTLFKGEVVEVSEHSVNKQPVQEYNAAFNDFTAHMRQIMKRHQSWWYKWLYLPYALTFRAIAYGIITVLDFLKFIIVMIVKTLTPL